jgi:hypothetical protein
METPFGSIICCMNVVLASLCNFRHSQLVMEVGSQWVVLGQLVSSFLSHHSFDLKSGDQFNKMRSVTKRKQNSIPNCQNKSKFYQFHPIVHL